MTDYKHRVRLVKKSDLSLILSWRNHEEIRKHMYNKKIISNEEHLNWFNKSNNDPKKTLLIYEYLGEAQGYINFEDLIDGGEEGVWGFYLSPFCKLKLGLAMGQTALKYGFDNIGYKKVWGEVIKENIISQRFHEKVGFTFKCFDKAFTSDIIVCKYQINDKKFYETLKNDN